MRAAEIDAVVTWQSETIRQLTGYTCWIDPLLKEYMLRPGGSGATVPRSAAIVTTTGEQYLIVEPLWAMEALVEAECTVRVAGDAPFIYDDELREVPEESLGLLQMLRADGRPGDLLSALHLEIRARGLDASRIGLDLDGTRETDWRELADKLPAVAWRNCSNTLRLSRAVKTEEEIGLMAEAAATAETAARAVAANMTSLSTPRGLREEFRALVTAAGAEFDHFVVGPFGLGFTSADATPIGACGPMYADFGCLVNGWFSDSGTTFCTDPLDERADRRFHAAREAVLAGAAQLHPGVAGSAIQAAMAEHLEAAGIVKTFPHGHGLGLTVRDYPLLMPHKGERIEDDCVSVSADLTMEAGMVVNLEAPIFVPGVDSFHCEETFVITTTGCEHLVPQERSAPLGHPLHDFEHAPTK
jgi:Xaa-Pro aminopeptidase